MPENSEPRVAVYLDFDNIVISRYDQVHGRNQFMRDRPRIADAARGTDPEISEKLALATVDIGAIIDFAASFGTLVLTRAYADWSAPVNADYRQQLVARAIDLVQLFPAAAYAKNGADIRLAVDAVEDMFRLPDLTHVVIVAGDSDYIALAQRCKRLGRYVIGVGVAGSTSKALAAACDEFDTYDSLPGVPALDRATARAAVEAVAAAAAASAEASAAEAPPEGDAGAPEADLAPAKKPTRRGSGKTAAQKTADKKAAEAAATSTAAEAAGADPTGADPTGADPTGAAEPGAAASSAAADGKHAAEASIEAALDAVSVRTAAADDEGEHDTKAPAKAAKAATTKRAPRRASTPTITAVREPEDDGHDDDSHDDEPTEDPQDTATNLLERALQLGHGKDDAEWLHSSAVKTHMKRMDPSFSEKSLGFRSFSEFVKARESIAELEETGHERLVRLRQP